MSPTVAVLLLTCGREDYTQETVSSFRAHNRNGDRFMLLHGDDASPTRENQEIAAAAGFETIHAPSKRQGQATALGELLNAARVRGADWVLWLESDWRWTGPFPWPLLDLGAECIRLYGDMKGPGNPTGGHLMGTREAIVWQPVSPGLDRGRAHWAGPPSATRTHRLAELAWHRGTLKEISLAGTLDTIRLRSRIVEHIGEVQTPDFME